MLSLFRTTRSRRGVLMVFDTAKNEEQKEYHIAWNALKRCCKKVDSQDEHSTGMHDRFLRDPVYRESQLANRMYRKKVQRVGWTCTRRPYISSHSRGKEKIPRTMVSYHPWNFDLIFEPLSQWKIVYTASQVNKLKSLSIQNNTVDDIPLQAHCGGTRPKVGGAHILFF